MPPQRHLFTLDAHMATELRSALDDVSIKYASTDLMVEFVMSMKSYQYHSGIIRVSSDDGSFLHFTLLVDQTVTIYSGL